MSLSNSAGVAQTPAAGNPLPFTKEAGARIENTWVRAGEAPLRIYKNEYDKPPVSYRPEPPRCVISQDTWFPRTDKEHEWDGLDSQKHILEAPQTTQPRLEQVAPVEDEGSGLDEYAIVRDLCGMKDDDYE